MRRYVVLSAFTLAFLLVALTVTAQSPEYLSGSWKTNFAKSTYSPGPPPTMQSQTSNWKPLGGGQFDNIIDSVDAKGQPAERLEIVLKFDGADYPLKGAAQPTTRSFKIIDARTFEFVQKVNGKVVQTTRSVLSADGKTRVLTTTGTNAQGQAVKNVVFWEKQ